MYNDHIRYEIENSPLLKRIVELRERNFAEKDLFEEAPQNLEDAIDTYHQVLDVVGDIARETIAPNAEEVDKEGPHCENGRVRYAAKTYENLDAMHKAGLHGLTMPRCYGGLNLPFLVNTAANEIVSAADASFENVWSLQDCIETLYCFGTEEQRKKYIPRVCQGASMSMDLTEPDAGSDLQSVMLRATYDEENACWRLNGTKRFITNGDSDIHLVLARSEEGTHDGRGLSMFIYDKQSGGVDVRRIENKMGIHGSPTCELVFRNAKAELCGERKLGLIKYVMSLMNGARLGIAAQSVGLSQAALSEAEAYAKERKQFGKVIQEIPAVRELLRNMRAKLDASRAILYETARFVDLSKSLEDLSRERKLTPEERQELKKYSRLADAFTPIAKGMASEYANQNAYDSIQVHGGSGFMLEYPCQRIYRDARITSIYEGTTQLQVVAALRYITNGLYTTTLKEMLEEPYEVEYTPIAETLKNLVERLENATAQLRETEDPEKLDLSGRPLYEITSVLLMTCLLLRNASQCRELFHESLIHYARLAKAEVEKNLLLIRI